MRHPTPATACLLTALCLVGTAVPVAAGPLRERLARLREQRVYAATTVPVAALPTGARVERDIAYGPHRAQRYDVYRPAHPDGRVLVLVHGGGWRRGDKAMPGVVDNKAAHWLPRGVTVVSVNYRLLPEADVSAQASDIAHALADVQRRARHWGASPDHLVLMGHSAGAHLVALLAADPAAWRGTGLAPWRATVALDSAALDVPALMAQPHAPLYDAAFGRVPADWPTRSPLHRLSLRATPLLLVCSRERDDASCGPARRFAGAAQALGVHAQVQPEALSHRDINQQLGVPGAYTQAVDGFLARADPAWR